MEIDLQQLSGSIGNGHDRDGNAASAPGYSNDRDELNVDGRRSDAKHVMCGEEINAGCLELRDDRDFESKEEAFAFYKEYAKSVGFNAIIKASRRSRISGKFIDAKFVCTRYGNKPGHAGEPPAIMDDSGFPGKKKRGRINRSWEKTDCKACMHVKRRPDGRWIICSFTKEHNHEILRDQGYSRRVCGDADIGGCGRDAVHEVRAKKMYGLMAKQYTGKPHGQVGQLRKQRNSEQHLRLDEGDAQALLDHFLRMQEENPHFFYALDLCSEQRLRNVIWVDAKSRVDYGYFSEVVFFDTLYIKNEYKMPLVPIVGVNHHSQSLLLGCALVTGETKPTYTWLMKMWLKAMGGRAPRVILTDQDIALKEAIAEVMPDARHCFCLWHILGKVPEKVSQVVTRDTSFMKKFDKCIFGSRTTEQFEKRWKKMVDRFDLGANLWFHSVYEDRGRWAPAYMRGIFLAGMSKAQRSDGVNSIFDKFIQRRTTLKEFLVQYKDILGEKYEGEAKSDFESWHKEPSLKSPSPFGKQMAAVYTYEVFRKFQVEVLGAVACRPMKASEDGPIKNFTVQDFETNRDHIIVRNEATADLSCSCRCFEFNGFLCRHAMIVLLVCGACSIPSQYILKRWTKDAKSRCSMSQQPSVTSSAQRYHDICWQALKLGDEGSLSRESYEFALNALEEAIKKCENLNNSVRNTMPRNLPPNHGSRDPGKVKGKS